MKLSHTWPLILAYHSVSEHRSDVLSIRPSTFERHIQALKYLGYRSVTLQHIVQKPVQMGERVVVLTFDDGYADNYKVAFPILRRYAFTATCFIVSDYTGTDHIHTWDRQHISDATSATPYRLLNWDQIYEMASFGIEIGSHTCTHPRLTQLPLTQRQDEISRSRIEIKERLSKDVVSFCYPAGDLDQDTLDLVEEAGYVCGVLTPPHSRIPLTKYTLRRVGLYHDISRLKFHVKIAPVTRRYYELFKSPHTGDWR